MTHTVRAVGSRNPLPVDDDSALLDVEISVGDPGPHDLLVDVRAVAVNPVDTKVRLSFTPGDAPTVLGFDAAGVVRAVGASVTGFAEGDEVYYAGSIARTGSNAEAQLVDARLVGHKPASLDFVEAAALPLTTITAWEALFDKFGVGAGSSGRLLVMGGAGGVGSVLTQLARHFTDLEVIATASRPESAEWARRMGAHHVVDHHRLIDEVTAVAPEGVEYVFSPYSAGNVETYAQLMTVFGEVCAIDEPEGLELLPLKDRSQTWHWELMFARPLHAPESTAHRDLLDHASRLVDEGSLVSTLGQRMDGLTAANVREAHRLIETGHATGKIGISVS